MRRVLAKYFGSVLFAVLLVSSIVLGAAAGVVFVYSSDLPEVQRLEDYRPNVVTEVYDDDGRIIDTFALERRIIVEPSQIPEVLEAAIVSVEDQNFYRHWGLDFTGISRAAIKNVLAGSIVEGGSTITQQLAENLFLSHAPDWSVKLQEVLLSIQIERYYSKGEILALYVNQIYLGHGMYGFAAASEYFFGKTMDPLTVEEAALLAALPRSPTNYSPINNPERALARRNYVIDRMVAEDRISVEEGETAKQRPILLNTPERTDRLAPHFIEQIRRYLENTYGTYAVHEGGLRVYTTLNSAMQRAAQAAVRQGLRDYDKRHGWRGPVTNLIRDGVEDLETHRLSGWSETIQAGRLLPGIVIESADQSATVRIGNFRGVIVPDDIAWTGRSSIREVLAPGDVATFLVESVDAAAATVDLALDQVPRVEGALVAIDHATGEVKAMVGGYDFKTSQFNRAVQAERQSGSGFKPLLYTAAIEEGMRPESMINDVRVNFNGYSPSNYDNAFRGPITLRRALADSRNVPAVQVLNRIGFDRLIPLIDRFGITATIERYLPIALGATDITLIEMTSAYSTFPNGGVRIDPRLINRVTDYDGDVLEENFPQPYDVIDTETASVMVDLLQEVVRSGTATRAQSLNRPAGGKTGTTNDYTDAWFLGFTADLTAGVWIGFDEKVNLGTGETGGRAALPIWISFMEEAHKDLPVVDFEWTVAPNLSRANNQASN
jgi:penicillin-binding protein 1A